MIIIRSCLLLFIIPFYQSSFIIPKKVCVDCKFFNPYTRECTLFGDTDVVTGETTYEYARSIRRDETKCGMDAKLYEENKCKFITPFYYFVLKNWAFFILTSLYVVILVNI